MEEDKLTVSILALLVSIVSVIFTVIFGAIVMHRTRQRDERQALVEKKSEQRELSRLRADAESLQNLLLLRIVSLEDEELRLNERIDALLIHRVDLDRNDETWLKEQQAKIERWLEDLRQKRIYGTTQLSRLKDKNFTDTKDLPSYEELTTSLRTAISAVDYDGGIKKQLTDLNKRVLQIERKEP